MLRVIPDFQNSDWRKYNVNKLYFPRIPPNSPEFRILAELTYLLTEHIALFLTTTTTIFVPMQVNKQRRDTVIFFIEAGINAILRVSLH